MKKLFFLTALTLLMSCTRDLQPLIEVELPSMTIQTPATQAGTFPLFKEVDIAEIDRLRGSGTVSLTSLIFSAIAPNR
jgi:uncharacterized lipoprotein YmbA